MQHALFLVIDSLFSEDIILQISDLMMHIFSKFLISNGPNHQIKNLEMNPKMLNPRLELLNLELITLQISTKEKFMYLVDMEVLVIIELPSMIFILMTSNHVNGIN